MCNLVRSTRQRLGQLIDPQNSPKIGFVCSLSTLYTFFFRAAPVFLVATRTLMYESVLDTDDDEDHSFVV
jgi:hypothetical protein